MRVLQIFIFIFLVPNVVMLDPYQLLNLNKNATSSQIKLAFREQSLKYHPDKNVQPQFQERFEQIIAAYEILKDPQTRQWFDLTGKIKESDAKKRSTNKKYTQFDEIFKNYSHGDKQTKEQSFETYQTRQFLDQYGRKRTVIVYKKKQLECLSQQNNTKLYTIIVLFVLLLWYFKR